MMTKENINPLEKIKLLTDEVFRQMKIYDLTGSIMISDIKLDECLMVNRGDVNDLFTTHFNTLDNIWGQCPRKIQVILLSALRTFVNELHLQLIKQEEKTDE